MQRPVPPRVSRFDAPPYVGLRRRAAEPPPGAGRARATGVLVAAAAAAVILTHALTMASAPAAAARTLRSVTPALTDLDQALAAHDAEIRAASAAGGESVTVPGLPLRVEVQPEAAEAGGEERRRAAVDAIAGTLYQEGHAAFVAADARNDTTPGLFTSRWALRRALDTLTHDAHDRFQGARTVSGALFALTLVLLLVQVDGRRWLAAAGSALMAGALIAALALVLAQIGVWLATAGGSDVAGAAVGRIAREVLITASITAGVAAAAGIVLLVAGVLVGRSATRAATVEWERRPRPPGRFAREPGEDR
jgi:hypothetical protein